MNSAFFPTKQRYCDTFRRSLIKWLRHHGLPTTLSYHAGSFLTTHWNNRQLHLQHEDRFTARSIKQLQEFLGDKVVLHHADYNISAFSAPRFTFVAVWPHGNHQNFSNHCQMIPIRPSPTSYNRPSPHTCARSTNGASPPNSTCHMEWFT